MFLPQFPVEPTRIMKHPSVPLKMHNSFRNKSGERPAAPNTSQINQQYYIKLNTDERLKDWRQGYNEFQLSPVCRRLSFAIQWRRLWHFKSSFVKTTIDHIFWSWNTYTPFRSVRLFFPHVDMLKFCEGDFAINLFSGPRPPGGTQSNVLTGEVRNLPRSSGVVGVSCRITSAWG